jgi:hypothetical protein
VPPPSPVRRTPTVQPTAKECDPPYRRGPNGQKIWKRECF